MKHFHLDAKQKKTACGVVTAVLVVAAGLFCLFGPTETHVNSLAKEENATGIVLEDTEKDSDVALTNLTGLIDMTVGEATVINLPTIKEGGTNVADMNLIKDVYENGTKSGAKIDKIAVAGTISRVVANKLDLNVDIEFAAPQATANAARKGLNVLALCVGDMTKSFVRELESEKIKYNIIDGRK